MPTFTVDELQRAFWVWGRQVFSWWGLLVALVVFMPAGFLVGYNLKQPSLVMDSTRSVLKQTNDVESFLINAEIRDSRDVGAKLQKLEADTTATENLTKTAPAALKTKLQTQLGGISADAVDLRQTLRAQNIAYDQMIDANLQKVRQLKIGVQNQAEATKDFPSVAYDQLRRFLKWIGALSFLTLFSAAVFFLLMLNPSFRGIVAKTGSISAFGVSLNFNDLQSVRASIRVRDGELEKDIVTAYTNTLKKSHLAKHFTAIMGDIDRVFTALGVDLKTVDYRATLFVPGFVGQELVQATQYSGTWKLGNEKAVGRRFSVRFGIIGKAWRLQASQYFPKVDNLNKNLLRNWGFTQDEITQAPNPASPPTGCLMAFCINDIGNSPPLGVIYIEADGADKLHPAATTGLSADTLLTDGSGMTTADKFADDNIWSKLKPDLVNRLKAQLIRLQSEMRWNDKIQEAIGR